MPCIPFLNKLYYKHKLDRCINEFRDVREPSLARLGPSGSLLYQRAWRPPTQPTYGINDVRTHQPTSWEFWSKNCSDARTNLLTYIRGSCSTLPAEAKGIMPRSEVPRLSSSSSATSAGTMTMDGTSFFSPSALSCGLQAFCDKWRGVA